MNKIVIVGGGTAGWMTATTLATFYPEKDITVIESPDYPTVGVGESTLGQLRRWTHTVGLDEKDFMRKCDASYKLSIKFTDFYDKGAGSFHYPFQGLYYQDSNTPYDDWHFAKNYHDLPADDFVDTFVPSSAMCNNNTYSPDFHGLDPDIDVAYHFDATKFGIYLRDEICIPKGVKVIASTVEKVVLNLYTNQGIDGLVLANEDYISADLFVDCTGFKALLMNAMGAEFLDYSDLLPNNRAWATRIPYKDKEKEMEPYTNCTAIETGWCWNIPLWSRLGSGYVYSDKYISEEGALQEFKNYLMSDYMTIPRTQEEVDALEYRSIKMRVGRYKESFIKNVVPIGLSAGFIEPLESNGLLSVHENLFYLSDILSRGKISEFDRQMYNNRVEKFFDDFATFVATHYSLSHRDDTTYWQEIQERHFDLNGDFDSPYQTKQQTFDYLSNCYMNTWSLDNVQAGMPFIAVGMNLNFINPWRADWLSKIMGRDYKSWTENNIMKWNIRKYEWDRDAKELPSLYEWLRDNRYED